MKTSAIEIGQEYLIQLAHRSGPVRAVVLAVKVPRPVRRHSWEKKVMNDGIQLLITGYTNAWGGGILALNKKGPIPNQTTAIVQARHVVEPWSVAVEKAMKEERLGQHREQAFAAAMSYNSALHQAVVAKAKACGVFSDYALETLSDETFAGGRKAISVTLSLQALATLFDIDGDVKTLQDFLPPADPGS